MPFPSLYLGFLFTLPGQLGGDSCVSTGRPLLLPGFCWWPLEAFEAFVFHPLSNPREPANEHSLLLTTHGPWKGSAASLPLSSFPPPPQELFKKFQYLGGKHFHPVGMISGETLRLSCSFDWHCLGHLIPHPRWAFCNTLGLNKLYFQRLRLDLAVNCPADVSVIFWTQEKVWELAGILWREEMSSAMPSRARIFLLQRTEFCLLLQVMALGQREPFLSGASNSGSSWTWVAAVVLPVALYQLVHEGKSTGRNKMEDGRRRKVQERKRRKQLSSCLLHAQLDPLWLELFILSQMCY